MTTLPVRLLHPDARLPRYSHPGDAGADLCSVEACVLAPGERRLIGTGIAIALPEGTVGFVTPRSGLAARHGITIVNAPGTVDAGYRGEIRICLMNTDPLEKFTVNVGDRIAQLVVLPITRPEVVEVSDLDQTARGTGGHGSTGV